MQKEQSQKKNTKPLSNKIPQDIIDYLKQSKPSKDYGKTSVEALKRNKSL